MIPKIIHTIWPGTDIDRYVGTVSQYLPSWLKYNPTYSFYFWTLDNLPADLLPSTKEIVAGVLHPVVKSDVLRLDILRLYGGIYRDADIECLRSFDDLLNDGSFCGIGRMNGQNALFGCMSGDPIITEAAEVIGKNVLANMEKILSMPNPTVFILETTLHPTGKYLNKLEKVYPKHYFYFRDGDKTMYTKHHWVGGKAGGWVYQVRKPSVVSLPAHSIGPTGKSEERPEADFSYHAVSTASRQGA